MREANQNKFQFLGYIRQLIAEDKIIKALEELETVTLEKEDSNFIVQQKSRLTEVNKQNRSNLISLGDLNSEKAKIRLAILNFLDEIEKENLGLITHKSQHNINRTNSLRIFLPGLLILFFLYIIVAFFTKKAPSTDTATKIIEGIPNSNNIKDSIPKVSLPPGSVASPKNHKPSENGTILNELDLPEEEMIQITVEVRSDSSTNLEGYTVYFDDTALISNKAITDVHGNAYLSFSKKQYIHTRSRIFAEFNGKKFTTGINHLIGQGGVITIKIN